MPELNPIKSPVSMSVGLDDYSRWLSQLSETRGNLGNDYDYKSWYANAKPYERSLVLRDSSSHFPDKYKTPEHMTFSKESIYHSDKTPGGEWVKDFKNDWHYYPSQYIVQKHSPEKLKDYFYEKEKGAILHMPNGEVYIPKFDRRETLPEKAAGKVAEALQGIAKTSKKYKEKGKEVTGKMGEDWDKVVESFKRIDFGDPMK